MNEILNTPKESIFYEDSRVLVALAYEPISKGHSVVLWKDKTEDINALSTEDYEYLMDVVDVARDTLREFYNVEKVYLMYLDEAKWVHWHLVPRYNEKGLNLLKHEPIRTDDFVDREELSKMFKENHQKMILEN